MLVQRRSLGINHSHVRVFKNKLFLASPSRHSSSGSAVITRHLEQLKVTSSSRGSKVDSLLAQAKPITCRSRTRRLCDRFLLWAEPPEVPSTLSADYLIRHRSSSCSHVGRIHVASGVKRMTLYSFSALCALLTCLLGVSLASSEVV